MVALPIKSTYVVPAAKAVTLELAAVVEGDAAVDPVDGFSEVVAEAGAKSDLAGAGDDGKELGVGRGFDIGLGVDLGEEFALGANKILKGAAMKFHTCCRKFGPWANFGLGAGTALWLF